MKIKQGHTIVGAVVLALAAAIAWAQSTSTPHTASAVVGTWELVSHDYNGQQAAPGQRQVKILAPGHFMWVIYDKDKMKTVGAGTGTWALSGDTYTEHIDFIDIEGGQGLNGTDQKFTVKVSGDTLTQTGNLGGTNMKEVWKRLP
jgi:hypothetical protein